MINFSSSDKKNLIKFIFLFFSFSFIFAPFNLKANDSFELSNEETKNDIYKSKFNLDIDYFETKPSTEYILGPGDKISITSLQFELDQILNSANIENQVMVPENSDLEYKKRFSYLVDGDGRISLPRLKNIYVEGLTIDELTFLLTKRYAEFFINPEINVDILTYRDIDVYLEGEVASPGLYTLPGQYITPLSNANLSESLNRINNSNPGKGKVTSRKPLTSIFPKLYDAIKFSGGITTYSDLTNIEIIRRNNISNGGGKIKAKIDFLEFINYGDNKNNIRLYDGDIIKIPKSNVELTEQLSKAIKTNLSPQFINVIVAGRVEQPGKLILNRSTSLSDAIEISGGIKVVSGPIFFYRYSSDGLVDRRRFRYKAKSKRGSYKNPILRNGDVVIVGKSGFNKTTELLREVTQPFIGINATYELIEKLVD